jgi:hypothetical protein
MGAKEAAHRLGRHQIAGAGFKASCPVPGHGRGRGDLDPSLSLRDGDNGRLVFNCLGNCSHEEVLDALINMGIATRDEHNDHSHRVPRRAKPLVNAHSNKTEKQADDWEPVPLDTEGSPDEAPEQILLRSGTLERGPGGFLLVTRDAGRKVTGKVDVTAIKKFTIRQADGRPVVIDVRIEFGWQDDKGRPNKEIRPVSLWRNRNTGKLEWKSRQWPRGKMQVYGQENVMPGDVVTIHEGPLKADIATEMLPQIKHVSFSGGSGMAGHHVWSFLKDCRVVGFADNDKPGKDAMKRIGELAIEAGARSFDIVEWASGTPAGHGIDDLVGQEAGADDADVMIEDAINRSIPETGKKQAFTKDAANLDTLTGFELHEDGVAQAFTANFKDFLKFCHTHGAWFHWTGTHWKLEQTSLAFAWAREICRQLGRS